MQSRFFVLILALILAGMLLGACSMRIATPVFNPPASVREHRAAGSGCRQLYLRGSKPHRGSSGRVPHFSRFRSFEPDMVDGHAHWIDRYFHSELFLWWEQHWDDSVGRHSIVCLWYAAMDPSFRSG